VDGGSEGLTTALVRRVSRLRPRADRLSGWTRRASGVAAPLVSATPRVIECMRSRVVPTSHLRASGRGTNACAWWIGSRSQRPAAPIDQSRLER